MPLSPPDPRKESHTRRITCQGYERDDGLWDIEAHLVDTRAYAYSTPWRGEITPGMPAHDMWLRWTIGADMVIRAIEVVTDSSPYPPSCPKAADSYQRLVGVNIGKGFLKEVQARIGRTEGCTHIYSLIHAAANSTMQTMAGSFWKGEGGGQKSDRMFGGDGKQPALLGTCVSYAPTSQVVARLWPMHYRKVEDDGR